MNPVGLIVIDYWSTTTNIKTNEGAGDFASSYSSLYGQSSNNKIYPNNHVLHHYLTEPMSQTGNLSYLALPDRPPISLFFFLGRLVIATNE